MVDEEKRKRDVWWDVREPKRESQEHRSNSKSPGERENVSVCSRSVLVQEPASRCYQSTQVHVTYIHTNTQLPHITERERERERRGERVGENEQHRKAARRSCVRLSNNKQQIVDAHKTRLSCLLFDSSFKVGGAASWGLHARVNRNHAQSTSSHNDCKSRTDVNVRKPRAHLTWFSAKGNSWGHIKLTSASTCRLNTFMTEQISF